MRVRRLLVTVPLVLLLLPATAALAAELCARGTTPGCCPLFGALARFEGASCRTEHPEVSRVPSCCELPAPPAAPPSTPPLLGATVALELAPHAEAVVFDTSHDLRTRLLGAAAERELATRRYEAGLAAWLSVFLI